MNERSTLCESNFTVLKVYTYFLKISYKLSLLRTLPWNGEASFPLLLWTSPPISAARLPVQGPLLHCDGSRGRQRLLTKQLLSHRRWKPMVSITTKTGRETSNGFYTANLIGQRLLLFQNFTVKKWSSMNSCLSHFLQCYRKILRFGLRISQIWRSAWRRISHLFWVWSYLVKNPSWLSNNVIILN